MVRFADDCMFDLDLCSWTNSDSSDNFDWKIGRSSEKRGTGPSRDQASSLNTRITTGIIAQLLMLLPII